MTTAIHHPECEAWMRDWRDRAHTAEAEVERLMVDLHKAERGRLRYQRALKTIADMVPGRAGRDARELTLQVLGEWREERP